VLLSTSLVQAQQIVASPPQNDAQTTAYWTAARKAAAKPMPLRNVSGAPNAAPVSVVQAASRNPGAVSGNLAAGATADPGLALAAAATPNSGVSPAIGPGSTIWYNYPPPSTLAIPTLDYFVLPVFPNTVLGKLFFSVPGGNAVCSAQSVTSNGAWGAGNRQTVVTAGHCCSDGAGAFYVNWRFEPTHLNGSTPGAWNAAAATVFTAWHTAGDLSVDFCILQMFKRNGQNINDGIGALGYAWGQTLPRNFVATGWPAAPPFSGGLLYYAFTSSAETDTDQAGLLPFTHGVGSQMTGGSSGGAWILKYQSFLTGANNYFNGLNSYKYTNPNRPDEMFGPYVDPAFVSLLQAVATAPPAP
jgi:hypothetical protein